MSSNEGRFETRGVWFFPQALHSSRFPAGEETLVPMTEVPNLSLPCSRVLAGYDFIEFEFSPVCYVVYLVFRLVVEMSFSLVFFFTTLNRKWCFTPFFKKIYQTISSKYILLGFTVIVRFKKPDESCGEELM